MMKKLIALLLCAALALSMAACATEGPEQTTAPAQTTATVETTEAVQTRENKLVFGSHTAITGDFTSALVGDGAADILVSDLLNDYSTMQTNRQGEYVDNPSVMESWQRTDNADGTATYTVKIRQGLCYNNGDAITAKDFLLRSMLSCAPIATELGIRSSSAAQFVGGEAYKAGHRDYVSGLRILDEYTFSMTVEDDYANYYYADTYVSQLAWNIEYWLGQGYDLTDTGKGVAFTKDGKVCQLTAAEVQAHFNAAKRGDNGLFISAGPYSLQYYDAAAGQVTLVRNPNYVGNFEGQKPSVKYLCITSVDALTWEEDLKTGKLDIYEGITDGQDINTAMALIDSGEDLQAVQFHRAGYGKLQFFCDVTPTQFVEVRRAIALLLDREAFAQTLCQGWGSVVNGPYAPCLWQYQAVKDRLESSLNSYTYHVEAAIAELEAGGWVLDAQGKPYQSGLRYKEVTAQQAKYMDECVTLPDGTILMPLVIKWMSSEIRPVSDLLETMLVSGEQTARAGMEIRQEQVDFSTLLDNLYRYSETDGAIEPYYSMTNVATGFTSALYDNAFYWSDDPAHLAMGRNLCRLYDTGEGGLDQLSMDMVYGEDVVGNEQAYLDLWVSYIQRWNQLLPELPLYSNIYVTVIPSWLHGYEQNALWGFQSAILYATIENAE